MSINTSIALQDDQTANMYEISFPDGVPGGGNALLMQYRADQQFDMPERILYTYEVEYQGIKIPKIGSKEDTTKEFTIGIRCDADWEVYKSVENWFKLCFDEKTGIYSGENDTRVPMIFRAFGPFKRVTKEMKFVGVKIKSFKITTWDHTTGDPIRIEAGFIYAYID